MSENIYRLKKSEIDQIIKEECKRSIMEIEGQTPSTVDLKEKVQRAIAILETEFVDLHQELAAHLTSQGASNRDLIELIKTFGTYTEALSQVYEAMG